MFRDVWYHWEMSKNEDPKEVIESVLRKQEGAVENFENKVGSLERYMVVHAENVEKARAKLESMEATAKDFEKSLEERKRALQESESRLAQMHQMVREMEESGKKLEVLRKELQALTEEQTKVVPLSDEDVALTKKRKEISDKYNHMYELVSEETLAKEIKKLFYQKKKND